ncbi:MAG: TIGR01777 family protein [Lentisphaerae bacterium RIFOXYA12_FULL_48_11]|nr:MAG: TIGR01777 family protein [Lentisphaerae bacterium RIFOXYA12_FULL_48_11]
MKILITGSSGFIGSALVSNLRNNGHTITRLIRNKCNNPGDFQWNPASSEIDCKAFEGVQAVIHLAGAGISEKRWTSSVKRQILQSRIMGTSLLCETISQLKDPPSILISASGIGYYGNRDSSIVDESFDCGSDFLANVAKQWEMATLPATSARIRLVIIRMGMVLDADGGALKKMLLPFQLGLGGTIGPGSQYMSWITLDDVLSAIQHILRHDTLKGPVNLTAPNPVTNQEFTKILGKVLRRPVLMHIPSFAIKVIMGEMAKALILNSIRITPRKLIDSGFKFKHPDLLPALTYILES